MLAPAFLVFPSQTGKNVSVDIYKESNLIYTIDMDNKGLPLKTEAGKLLDIVVDFSSEVNVSIAIKDWGTTDIDQEF